MSTRFSDFFYCYQKETSYATKTYDSGGTFLKFGNHADPYDGLSTEIQLDAFTANNTVQPTYYPGRGSIGGPITFDLINGIPLFMALGGVSNNDAGSPKVHTITPQTAGSAINSYLVHREMARPRGTGDWAHDFFGCKVDSLDIWGRINQNVKCTLSFVGSKPVAGTVLDEYPINPPTANTTPFKFKSSTMTWNSTEQVLLVSFRFTYNNGLNPVHTHRATNTEWCEFLDRADEARFNASLGFIASEHAILDDLISQTPRTFNFDLIRTAASDEIKITFANTYPTSVKYPIPDVKEKCVVAVVLNPQTVSAVVKDSITGGTYYV